MATSYLVLGQAASTTSAASLYTAAAQTVVSTITACNVTSSAATATINIGKSGAAAATSNAVVYQYTVPAYTTATWTLGITMASTDILYVSSGTSGALTFQAFGSTIV